MVFINDIPLYANDGIIVSPSQNLVLFVYRLQRENDLTLLPVLLWKQLMIRPSLHWQGTLVGAFLICRPNIGTH
ncbi:hypothetical protein M758_8G092500 [Ceratodon purpureus]|nr:hypothetical protein M758_8G092500 [Ceratodon purpureus]